MKNGKLKKLITLATVVASTFALVACGSSSSDDSKGSDSSAKKDSGTVYRTLDEIKKDGTIITNTQEVEPMPVITGAAAYPENLIEKMQAAGAKVDAKDFLSIAQEAGSAKAVNIALMGRLSTYFPEISDEQWQDAIEKIVPPKFLDLNRKAFEAGRNA